MIGAAAAASALLALVDTRLRTLVWAALALALVALLRERRPFLPALALCLSALALLGFSTGADSLNYFAYTSSLLADQDLDFANQWSRFGFAATTHTPIGRIPNPMSIGPGLVWSPAVAATHFWLTITGGRRDALAVGAPYFAAAAATSLAIALAGVFSLRRELGRILDATAAWMSVVAVVLCSPILYYVTVQPLMSHAPAFGAGCFVVASTLRAERQRSLADWAVCGAALGFAMLMRTQALSLSLVLIAGLYRSRARVRHAGVALLASLVVFLPQVLSWRALYGTFLTIPQGDGFIDWSGDHWFDVLFSADRGLFNWHPALLLGLAGLLLALRGFAPLGLAGLMAFAFTAFLNGSVRDWNASAAFGARRFDVVLPLLGFGFAVLLSRIRPILSTKPMMLPALLLSTAAVWNISIIDVSRGTSGVALPLDEVARLQVGQARRFADRTVGVLGPRARDAVYRVFVGLFAYENYRPGGEFDLATLEARFLGAGWSETQAWNDGTLFRYLMFPKACITVPIDEPFDLRGVVTARAPARISDQRVTVTVNERAVTASPLPAEWTDIAFAAPARFWVAGENRLCLVAASKRPGDEGDDRSYAAAVVRVQFP